MAQKKFQKKDSEKSFKKTDYRKRSNPKRGRNNSRPTSDETVQNGNRIQRNVTADIPASSVASAHTLLFPPDSAAIGAFGNYVVSPGQENFLTAFNKVSVADEVQSTHTYTFSASNQSARSATAMVIGITHYFGSVTQDPNLTSNPIQMAAVNLKQFIDTSFGTNTAYDPQDLMLYLMAVSAVFPYIAEIKRDLKLTLTTQPDHYPQFVPRGLYAALQIPDDNNHFERGEGASYTATYLRGYIDRLNQLIDAFNRLPIPPEIGIFNYNDYLFDNIYYDSDDPTTAQLYVFKNEEVWEYDETGFQDGPQLKLIKTGIWTIAQKLDQLESMIMKISAMRTSSSAMLQNLFNAYGSKDTLQVERLIVTDPLQVDFVYDPNILTMVENSLIATPEDINISYIVPRHDESFIKGYVYFKNVEHDTYMAVNVPLQFHKPVEDVTPEDIGWAMRLHPIFLRLDRFNPVDADHDGSEYIEQLTCHGLSGFAIARSCNIALFPKNGRVITVPFERRRTDDYERLTEQYFTSWLAQDFHAAPIIVEVQITETDANTKTMISMYSAKRDLEVTYRLEDIFMYWNYLTLHVWAANVNRNVEGSRTRFFK